MGITRRDLLRGVAVGSAGLALGACGSDGAAAGGDDAPEVDAGEPRPIVPPEGTPVVDRFPLGISAGDLHGDRVVVWARYAGTAALAAFAWRVEGDTYVEELGPFTATPADAGFTHVAITGLRPGARYRYTFFELAGDMRTGRSIIGGFRAPIADDALEPLTFGAISCTDKGRSTDPIWRAAEEDNLDAFLFLGDNAYCEATEIAGYRKDYEDHYGRDAHIALRASTGHYITWDDHELANNVNPENIPPAQLEAAFRCFFEHSPYVRDTAHPNRIWRSARWGKTVELFVLDSRSERKPSTRTTANAEYLSTEQLSWLEAGLAASPCVFKVIMNSVPITNMPTVWDVAPADRWEGYAAQRTRILQFIDTQQITGVAWVAGDFHLAFISKVSSSGAGSTQREILVGPGGQTANPLWTTLNGSQFQYRTGTNNFTKLKFDPAARAITVTYTDGAGTAFHSELVTL